MSYALRPMVREPVQWNPAASEKPPIHWYDEGFNEMHPAVRSTNYLEINSLLGTSGCSKDAYGWTWSVMGVIETNHGKLAVAPNNWIFEPIEGVYVVLTDEEFRAMFYEKKQHRRHTDRELVVREPNTTDPDTMTLQELVNFAAANGLMDCATLDQLFADEDARPENVPRTDRVMRENHYCTFTKEHTEAYRKVIQTKLMETSNG